MFAELIAIFDSCTKYQRGSAVCWFCGDDLSRSNRTTNIPQGKLRAFDHLLCRRNGEFEAGLSLCMFSMAQFTRGFFVVLGAEEVSKN